jgi:hypothetical protein
LDAALQDLWTAVRTDVPYNTDAAIVKYWRDHWKELGSPVGPERRGDNGTSYQAFTRGLARWTGSAVELV